MLIEYAFRRGGRAFVVLSRQPRSGRVQRTVAGYLLAVAFGISSSSVYAEQLLPDVSSPPTEAELRLMPEYCPYTDGYNLKSHETPEKQRWARVLGETFWALHHYCNGILGFNRAQLAGYPVVTRQSLLNGTLGEFRYVLNHMPEDYVLAPEIYTYIGRVHLGLSQPSHANAAFAKARAAKPDYWPAYSWWANYLLNKGEKERAREIATEGLTHAPDSRTLQLILQDLDSQKRGTTGKRAAQ